jgi:hypothetical protein
MTYMDQGQRPLKRDVQFLDQKHRNGRAVEKRKQRCVRGSVCFIVRNTAHHLRKRRRHGRAGNSCTCLRRMQTRLGLLATESWPRN